MTHHGTTTDRNQPHRKVPEHLSTSDKPATKDEKIDAQMADSFPASDPPSYSGGNHIIGAPNDRESQAPAPDDPAVLEAEKKVKQGTSTEPGKY
jgi:hypothetical protein